MSDFESKIHRALNAIPPTAPVLVGFSGGLDSTVLLHLIAQVLPARRVTAIHINHGLSDHARAWQRHCQTFCQSLGINLVALAVTVTDDGHGIEQAARAARYSAFAKHVPPDGRLLLAHHRDDQVETLLLRLLRGSGPDGLAAMRQQARFAEGYLLRPLLDHQRAELQGYAQAHQLTWVDDPSNQSSEFDRNFLRGEVLPLIARRWPSYAETLARTAGLCRQQAELTQHYAHADLNQLGIRAERVGASCNLAQLRAWPLPRQINALRCWLSQTGSQYQTALPSQAVMQQVAEQLLPEQSRSDSRACVTWPAGQFRRYQGRLYILPHEFSLLLPTHSAEAVEWRGEEPLLLPQGGRLSLIPGGRLRWQGEPLRVVCRRGGERCHPYGRKHSQTLKKLLQEVALEPWLRDRIPLLYVGVQLLAVGDCWVEKHAASEDCSTGYRLQWQVI